MGKKRGTAVRVRSVAAAVATVALIALAAAGPATAGDDEQVMGVYRVKDGKLTQSFGYLASSYSVDYGSGECWEDHFNSKGTGSYDLRPIARSSFKKLDGVVKAVYDHGAFELRGLRWAGAVRRQTDYAMRTTPGPNYDDSCAPSSHEPPETVGCGDADTEGDSQPMLVPYSHGFPILDNHASSGDRVGLFGAMPDPLGLYPCPSESAFGAVFAAGRGDQALSNTRLDDFERFRKRIEMKGSMTYSGKRYFTAFAGLEKGSGSQNASASWSLDLKCVKRC